MEKSCEYFADALYALYQHREPLKGRSNVKTKSLFTHGSIATFYQLYLYAVYWHMTIENVQVAFVDITLWISGCLQLRLLIPQPQVKYVVCSHCVAMAERLTTIS